MKQKFLLLVTACILSLGSWAQDEFTIGFGGGVTNSLTLTDMGDGSWWISTNGGDPFVSMDALPRDLTEDEDAVIFEYKSDRGVSDCEFFFSRGGMNAFAGGIEQGFKIPASADWTEMSVDISTSKASFGWGFAGENLRFDCGTDAGESVFIRNVHFGKYVKPVYELEGLTKAEDGVYELATADDLEKFALYSQAGLEADARLVADIDYSGKTAMIGKQEGDIYYDRHFDGQGHTITLDVTTTVKNVGIFEALSGTVENLIVKGTVVTSNQFVSSIAAHTYAGAKINNCMGFITVESSMGGDTTHGGLVAVNESGVTITNSGYFGTMTGENSNNNGGIVGWSSGATTLINCIFGGDMSGLQQSGSNYMSRNFGNVKCINCYYVIRDGMTGFELPGSAIGIQDEMLANGGACFLLNGDQTEIGWRQNIGEDTLPNSVDKTKKQVYAQGEFRCDRQPIGDVEYSNTESTVTYPEHNFVDGACTECGQADPGFLTIVDGWYEVTNADQLMFIAKMVNNNATEELNVRLMNDIDMSGVENFTPIGNVDTKPFTGTFDGQGYTIHALKVEQSENFAGLIGCVKAPATVKNLTLDAECSITGAAYCGIVGESIASGGNVTLTGLGNEGTVSGTGANIAGIFGCCMSSSATIIMSKCWCTGAVNGATESGALSGWFGGAGSATDCWTTSEVTGTDNDASYVGRGTCTYTRVYSVGGDGSQGAKISREDVESGAFTYNTLNNGAVSNIAWYQTIGEDTHPVLDSTHGIVYPVDAETYASFQDDASFAAFQKQIIDAEKGALEDAIATQTIIDDCMASLDELTTISDKDEFLAAYGDFTSLKNDFKNSVNAYKAYIQKAEEVTAFLEENQGFQGEGRDLLTAYLLDEVDPNDDYEFGSYSYIVANHTLTTTEIKEETTKIQTMLETAMAADYDAGANITKLLKNGDFKDGFNGWQNSLGTGTYYYESVDIVGCENWDGSGQIYQTLEGLKEGVYFVSMAAAYRPSNDPMSYAYNAYIYLNDNCVYMPSCYETYMPVEEAVDGVNCNLSISAADVDQKVTDENGETIGYAIHGTPSIAIAAAAGRSICHMIANVTDGKLTVGVNDPGSKYGSDWTGWANIQLVYLGSMEDADAQLSTVLEDQIARANTLLNKYQFESGELYTKLPNFSQALRDQLTAEIAEAEAATTPEGKYAVVEKFSQTFKDIYTCKRNYVDTMTKVEDFVSLAAELYPENMSEEDNAAITAIAEESWAGYEDGTLDCEAEQAKLAELESYGELDENGVWQINNMSQFIQFIQGVRSGRFASTNASLNCDIPEFTESMIIDVDYKGVFNGNYHTIFMNMTRDGDNCSMFLNLYGSVKNLIFRGTLTESAKFAAPVASHTFGAVISNISSYVDIVSSIVGDGTHGGIIAVAETGNGNTVIENCLFAGTMTGAETNSCGGIVGWTNGLVTMNNCLQIADIKVDPSGGATLGRCGVTSPSTFYLNAHGDVQGTQTTEDKLLSGEACYLLNNSMDAGTWHQDLGVDPFPVPDPTRHQAVAKDENGNYINVEGGMDDEMLSHAGTEKDPYPIRNVSNLRLMKSLLTNDKTTYFTLEEDIDMSPIANWTCLVGTTDFGHIDFDGKGHVLKNMKSSSNSTKVDASFIGVLMGSVRNVGFENVDVTCANEQGCGILCRYCGLSGHYNETTYIENVWITGKLTVPSKYCGGLIGNVGGPSVVKNVFLNVDVFSGAENTGAFIGRIRDAVTVENVYVAGTCNKYGFEGGGQQAATPASSYKNVVVWNNTTENFGPVADADKMEGISFYNGSNFAELQKTVVAWGAPWCCGMGENEYPTFDFNNAIQKINGESASKSGKIYNLNGVQVEKATKGIFIIDGQKKLVK